MSDSSGRQALQGGGVEGWRLMEQGVLLDSGQMLVVSRITAPC